MTAFFQVDAGFYDHPLTAGMSDAAWSLWVRAGSYSADQRTAGFIPLNTLAENLRTSLDAAEELVQRGLWRKRADGYQFERIGWFIGAPGWRPWIPTWLRRLVMDRDGRQCVNCGSTRDLSLDHIYPYSKGGNDTEGNLQVLCLPCNSAKGARD